MRAKIPSKIPLIAGIRQPKVVGKAFEDPKFHWGTISKFCVLWIAWSVSLLSSEAYVAAHAYSFSPKPDRSEFLRGHPMSSAYPTALDRRSTWSSTSINIQSLRRRDFLAIVSDTTWPSPRIADSCAHAGADVMRNIEPLTAKHTWDNWCFKEWKLRSPCRCSLTFCWP